MTVKPGLDIAGFETWRGAYPRVLAILAIGAVPWMVIILAAWAIIQIGS